MIFAYLRVSSKHQTLENQQHEITNYAKKGKILQAGKGSANEKSEDKGLKTDLTSQDENKGKRMCKISRKNRNKRHLNAKKRRAK